MIANVDCSGRIMFVWTKNVEKCWKILNYVTVPSLTILLSSKKLINSGNNLK
jgi:hypothetical protein